MKGHSIYNVFRCVNSVSELYLYPWDTSLMLHVFFIALFCVSNCVKGHIHGMMDMEIICMV